VKKLISTILAAGVIFAAAPALAAHADPEGKVFVCKYVGTPGSNERLQTGQNPIDVSINAIKDYNGVGSYFNDAQGRSYVLAEDVGQDEPDVSLCPPPDNGPPPPEQVRYRIVVRMSGVGVLRTHVLADADSSVTGTATGVACGKKVTAGFSFSIGGTGYTLGPYTSRKGPILRIKTAADGLVLKVRASTYC
jgi:hypothetical protein